MKIVLGTPQISDTNMEYLIDMAINLLNLRGAGDISNMSGSAGTKEVNVDSPTEGAIFVSCRAIYHSDPTSFGFAGLNVSVGDVLSNPEVLKQIDKAASTIAGVNVRRG
jgi:hypothetical protein